MWTKRVGPSSSRMKLCNPCICEPCNVLCKKCFLIARMESPIYCMTIALLLLYTVPIHGWELHHFPQEKMKTGSNCCPVDTSKLWTKTIRGLDETASAALKPLLHYKFYLPNNQLRSGLAYYGASRRLRKFVLKLLEGRQPLKMGILGGR